MSDFIERQELRHYLGSELPDFLLEWASEEMLPSRVVELRGQL